MNYFLSVYSPDPYNNVSYLINANYSAPMQYFSMGRFDGWLQVNLTGEHILDRDFGQSEFTLNLKLRDNYLVDDVTCGYLDVTFGCCDLALEERLLI